MGTEPGKIRPVIVVQTDLLNLVHTSTIVCPITTKTVPASILRVHVPKKESGLREDSDILVDQIRAIDNMRLIKPLGQLHEIRREKLIENLQKLILE